MCAGRRARVGQVLRTAPTGRVHLCEPRRPQMCAGGPSSPGSGPGACTVWRGEGKGAWPAILGPIGSVFGWCLRNRHTGAEICGISGVGAAFDVWGQSFHGRASRLEAQMHFFAPPKWASWSTFTRVRDVARALVHAEGGTRRFLPRGGGRAGRAAQGGAWPAVLGSVSVARCRLSEKMKGKERWLRRCFVVCVFRWSCCVFFFRREIFREPLHFGRSRSLRRSHDWATAGGGLSSFERSHDWAAAVQDGRGSDRRHDWAALFSRKGEGVGQPPCGKAPPLFNHGAGLRG